MGGGYEINGKNSSIDRCSVCNNEYPVGLGFI
jgi:hypothetical protein